MEINLSLQPEGFAPRLQRFWELSRATILQIEQTYDFARGNSLHDS